MYFWCLSLTTSIAIYDSAIGVQVLRKMAPKQGPHKIDNSYSITSFLSGHLHLSGMWFGVQKKNMSQKKLDYTHKIWYNHDITKCNSHKSWEDSIWPYNEHKTSSTLMIEKVFHMSSKNHKNKQWLWPQFGVANNLTNRVFPNARRSGLVLKSTHWKPIYLTLIDSKTSSCLWGHTHHDKSKVLP
jgi:hypothetical protein